MLFAQILKTKKMIYFTLLMVTKMQKISRKST